MARVDTEMAGLEARRGAVLGRAPGAEEPIHVACHGADTHPQPMS